MNPLHNAQPAESVDIICEAIPQFIPASSLQDQYRFIFTAVASMFERFLQTSDDGLYCNLSEVKHSDVPEHATQEEVLSKQCGKKKCFD